MNGMPLKQKAAVAVLVTVALYAVLVVGWFMNLDAKMSWCTRSWATAIKKYNSECARYESERKLISETQYWTDEYDAERKAMPTFAENVDTSTHWLRKLGGMAERHHLSVPKLQSGEEQRADDVLELQISVGNCEGALETLVRFMHELENTDEGMFDIPSISIQPISNKKGYLKASFAVTCAYMRGDLSEEAEDAEGAAATEPAGEVAEEEDKVQ